MLLSTMLATRILLVSEDQLLNCRRRLLAEQWIANKTQSLQKSISPNRMAPRAETKKSRVEQVQRQQPSPNPND